MPRKYKSIFDKSKSLAREMFRSNRKITSIEIIKRLKENGESAPNERAVRYWMSEFRSETEEGLVPEIELTEEEMVSDSIHVDASGYTLKNSKVGTIHLTIDQADQLFYEFSSHGLNMTQTQIINKHGFTPIQWHHIKRKLSLYKLSNIFSQWRVENTPSDELEKMMQDKIRHALRDKLNIENQYNKTLSKEIKKNISEYERRDLAKQALITGIADMFPSVSIEKVSLKVDKKAKSTPIIVATADWHVGSKTSSLKNTLPYSPEILSHMLTDMAVRVNQEGSSDVTLVINGDIIESFTGLSHKNSFQQIEFGYTGPAVVIEAFKKIRSLIGMIANVKRVVITSGNHDRWSESREFDQAGGIAEIIAYMLKLQFSGKSDVSIIYDASIAVFELHSIFGRESINVLVAHGHNKKENRKPEKLLFDYGDKMKYNLVLMAHLHSRMIHSDTRGYRVMRIPSLFTGNQYSEELGHNSLPGFLIIKNIYGLPEVIDVPLFIR